MSFSVLNRNKLVNLNRTHSIDITGSLFFFLKQQSDIYSDIRSTILQGYVAAFCGWNSKLHPQRRGLRRKVDFQKITIRFVVFFFVFFDKTNARLTLTYVCVKERERTLQPRLTFSVQDEWMNEGSSAVAPAPILYIRVVDAHAPARFTETRKMF